MIADLVVTHVRLWVGPGETATAFAVRGDRFAYVGDAEGAAAFVGDGTRTEDWGDAFAVPGFVDAHAHVLEGGLELAECPLSDAETAAQVLDRVARCAAEQPRGWLVGSGWPLTAFPAGNPTAAALDAVVGDRPAFLLAADGHSGWLSTAGLRRVGYGADTADPPGGRIERDAAGRPTGTVREAAVDPVYDRLPAATRRERAAGVLAGQSVLLGVGVTSVLEANADLAGLRTFRTLARSGELALGVSIAMETDPAAGPGQVRRLVRWRRRFDGVGGLRVATAKLFVDGVLESRTAAMLAPYADTGATVAPDWSADTLRDTVAALLRAGLEVHAHTIGDRAVRDVLDAVAAARAEGLAGRVALAHVEAVDPADVPRFAALDVDAVFSPLWAYPDEYVVDLTWPGLSPALGARLYPIGELARAGAPIAFGSDWSVSSPAPLEGLEVAVTRRDPDDPAGPVLGVDQALSPDDALAAYTSGAGRVVGLGTGRAAPGARADVVVLSADPRGPDPSSLRVTRILAAGRAVTP